MQIILLITFFHKFSVQEGKYHKKMEKNVMKSSELE